MDSGNDQRRNPRIWGRPSEASEIELETLMDEERNENKEERVGPTSFPKTINQPKITSRFSRLCPIITAIASLALVVLVIVVGYLCGWLRVSREDSADSNPITSDDDIRLYIHRTLLSPHFITNKSMDTIFNRIHQDTDVFLFTGIHVDQFKGLTNGRVVPSNSNDQIAQQWLTSRFMLLDDPSHINNISRKTKRSLHWLHYERDMGKMRLIRSKGTLDIWEQLKPSQEVELSEDDFIFNLMTDRNVPICISGETPFSQSMFLSRIARRLAGMFPEINIVILSISDFTNKFQNVRGNVSEEVVNNVLGTEFGIKENVTTELLVYGIELPEPGLELAFDILGKITSLFDSTRVWVAAGKESSYAESKLTLLCHKLKPLGRDDQLQILSKYWSRHEKLNESRLNEFANVHLEALSNGRNLKFNKLDDTGLELTLLAEVYDSEAREYAGLTATQPLSNTTYLKIADLYEKMIQMKIKQYQKSSGAGNGALEETQLMNMFARMSLQLLFPDKFEKLKEQLGPVDLVVVMKVDIHEESEGSAAFKYDGLADYFLSWLAIKGVKGEPNFDQDVFIEFLNETVFSMLSKLSRTYVDRCTSIYVRYEFDHENIAYFFDHFIQEVTSSPGNSITLNLINSTDIQQLNSWYGVCASSRFINILKLLFKSGATRKILDELGASTNDPQSFFSNWNILSFAMYSNLEVYKDVLAQFQGHGEWDVKVKEGLLRNAVHIGQLPVVEYSIKDMQLDAIFKNMGGDAERLLHSFTQFSERDSDHDINEKIKLMRLLVGINPGLLEQREWRNKTPLLLESVHFRFKIELIHLGANVLARDKNNDTLLHRDNKSMCGPNMSRDKLQSLVLNIPVEILAQLTMKNSGGMNVSTLESILLGVDPTPQTIEAFGRAGVDFNWVNGIEDYPILPTSIHWGVNVGALRKMIEFGADISWKGEHNQTLLHISAESGHYDATILLLDEFGFDVNVPDMNGYTPLDYAIKSNLNSNNHQCVYKSAWALHERGGRLTEVSYVQLPNNVRHNVVTAFEPQHIIMVTNRTNFDVLELLLRIGKLPGLDRKWNTPLHLAMRYHRFDYPDTDHLSITKLLLDNNTDWTNAENDNGETPLHLALKNDHIDFETFQMLKSRTKMNWTTSLANLCLATVIRSGNAEQVVSLMKECEDLGADYNFKNYPREFYPYSHRPIVHGFPLHIAAGHCQERAVHYLVEEKGADISPWHATTPLLTAAARCKDKYTAVRIIKYLAGKERDVCMGVGAFLIFFDSSPKPLVYQWYELQEYLASKNCTGSSYYPGEDFHFPYRFERVSRHDHVITTQKAIIIQNVGSVTSTYKVQKH